MKTSLKKVVCPEGESRLSVKINYHGGDDLINARRQGGALAEEKRGRLRLNATGGEGVNGGGGVETRMLGRVEEEEATGREGSCM
jgi:hypothetical protein